jgi:hypothetical protein
MIRALLAAGGILASAVLCGCQTWQDRADAAALAECDRIGDEASRKACRADVMAGYAEAKAKENARLEEAVAASEERELAREVYGDPKDRH